MRLPVSGSQTVGPYLHIGLTWLNTTRIARPGVQGERVAVQGRLLDGDGAAVSDRLIQIRPADGADGATGIARLHGRKSEGHAI